MSAAKTAITACAFALSNCLCPGQASVSAPTGYVISINFARSRSTTQEQREETWKLIEQRARDQVQIGKLDSGRWAQEEDRIKKEVLTQPDWTSNGKQVLLIGLKGWKLTIEDEAGTRHLLFDGEQTFEITGSTIVTRQGLDLSSERTFPLLGINLPGLVVFKNNTASQGVLLTGRRSGPTWTPNYLPVSFVQQKCGQYTIAVLGGKAVSNGTTTESSSSGIVKGGRLEVRQFTKLRVQSAEATETYDFEVKSIKEQVPTTISIDPYLKENGIVRTPDGVSFLYNRLYGNLEQQQDRARFEKSRQAVSNNQEQRGLSLQIQVILVIALCGGSYSIWRYRARRPFGA